MEIIKQVKSYNRSFTGARGSDKYAVVRDMPASMSDWALLAEIKPAFAAHIIALMESAVKDVVFSKFDGKTVGIENVLVAVANAGTKEYSKDTLNKLALAIIASATANLFKMPQKAVEIAGVLQAVQQVITDLDALKGTKEQRIGASELAPISERLQAQRRKLADIGIDDVTEE